MWLAMDTATDRASVALGDRAADAAEASVAGARRHAADLLPLICTVLERAGTRLAEVEGILVADGPGSFTGLRVGAALAKGLARAGKLELWTAPSLLVRAAAHAGQCGLVLAVSNALRGEVYAAAYRFPEQAVETIMAPKVQRPEALLDGPVPDRVVGDAPPEAVERLERWTGRPLEATEPCARHLLELRHRRGGARPVGDIGKWEPAYGRLAEAQARWENEHGRRLPDPDRRTG